MIKNYDEDKQESKIIFDDSSIEKINRIIENHEILFVEFPLYEIQITKKSINKIFSLGKIGIEENLLFSYRINDNSFTTNYSKILDLVNTSLNKSNNNILTSQDKISNDNDSIEKSKIKINRGKKNKPATMKVSKNAMNEFKAKIRNDETLNELNKINENEVYSDDEYEKININNIINPQIIPSEKRTNTSFSLSPKFYGCIGENYDSVIKIWIFFYFSLILISIILFGYKIYYIKNSNLNSVFIIALIIDFLNFFVGIYGLNNLNKFIQMENDLNYDSKILNFILIFGILLSSFFLIYCHYFQTSAFIGNIFMNDSLYKNLSIFSLGSQICCLYINLQMDKFYIDNNMLLPLREPLL